MTASKEKAEATRWHYKRFSPKWLVILDQNEQVALLVRDEDEADRLCLAVNNYDALVKLADAGHELATLAETIHEGADKTADTWIGELLRRVDAYREAYVEVIAKVTGQQNEAQPQTVQPRP